MSADYKKAGEEATKLLLGQRLYNLKIDVATLRYNEKIIFHTYKSFCCNSLATMDSLMPDGVLRDGCTVIRKNGSETTYIVLYNENIRSTGRRRFTLAHEVGHIMLRHSKDSPAEEAEANFFAAQLLLPPALVWKYLLQCDASATEHDVAQIFGTSVQAAKNRLKSLKSRPGNGFSESEMLLCKRFGGLLPQSDGPIISI